MKSPQEESLKALEIQIELNALYDQLKNSKCIEDDNIRNAILNQIHIKEEYYAQLMKGEKKS